MNRMILGIILLYPLLLYAVGQRNEPLSSITEEVHVPVLAIDGVIGPAVSDYIVREIDQINQINQAPIIILTLNTPGGLSASLRDIVQRILSSNIPLACLVTPQGARAASAGTYILYACHVAAMSPTTTLGTATPVMLPGPMSPKQPNNAENTSSVMEKKVLNDAIAYIRSLAQLRQRNQEWAELAVSKAASLTASEALKLNVIDLIADSPQQLLSKLSDPALRINQPLQLIDLSQAILDPHAPDWRNEFIATITNPNIAYILMLIGIYGLLLEFYSPGIGVAGVTGAISLFIALYALQMLPLNYAGLALILLGIIFLAIEAMMPSVGVFGIGGLIAFVIGSIFLLDTDQPQFQVSLQLIATLAVLTSLFFFYVIGALWRLRQHQIVSGMEGMIGSEVIVETGFSGNGYVSLGGERWVAHSDTALRTGQVVRIEAIEGLTLIIATP
jgi:membrane-bound serine protease (ClpP class)